MALGAAVSWGLAYTVLDKILRLAVDPLVVLMLVTAGQAFLLGIIIYIKGSADFAILKQAMNTKMLLLILFSIIAFVIGNMLVFQSIQLKNAVLVNLIEITYPVFTFIFTWLLLREATLTISTAIGAMLIIIGAAIVFVKS